MTVYTAVKHIFQNAAIATGNGTALPLAGLSTLGLQVEGIVGDTITFEGTIDGTTWYSIQAMNVADGGVATTATADGLFVCSVAGLDQFRARLTRVGGTVTITGRAVSGGALNFADVDIVGTEDVNVTDRAARDCGKIDIAAFDVALPAGEAHVGEVGASSTVVAVTPAITAGAYTALDIVGAIQTIASAARASAKEVILQSVVITDLAALTQAFTIWFFNANPSNGTYTDNLALDIHDTDLGMCIGLVKVAATDYASAADNSVAVVRNIGLVLKPAVTSLFAIAQCTGTAPTYASVADLTFKYGFLRD